MHSLLARPCHLCTQHRRYLSVVQVSVRYIVVEVLPRTNLVWAVVFLGGLSVPVVSMIDGYQLHTWSALQLPQVKSAPICAPTPTLSPTLMVFTSLPTLIALPTTSTFRQCQVCEYNRCPHTVSDTNWQWALAPTTTDSVHIRSFQ